MVQRIPEPYPYSINGIPLNSGVLSPCNRQTYGLYPDPISSTIQMKLIELTARIQRLEDAINGLTKEPSASSIKKLPESRLDDSWYYSSQPNYITNEEIYQLVQAVRNRNNDL